MAALPGYGATAHEDVFVTDINGRRNVAGPGVNGAQRVMNAAGASQILVSQTVHETLRYREAYMRCAFREVPVTIKHGDTVLLYQLVADGKVGLNVELHESLKPRPSPRMSRIAAYYLCFAKKYEQEFLDYPNGKGSSSWERSAEVMYFMMADDAVETELAGEFDSPAPLMLMPKGDVSYAERLEYYYAQDSWLRFAFSDEYIESIMLRGLSACFHGRRRLFVNDRGVAMLKRDHPDLAARFKL